MGAGQGHRDGTPRGWFERVLFSFMGPPQVGDVHAPAAELPARPVALCPRCRRPYDEHEIVRDPGLTYARCPGDASGG